MRIALVLPPAEKVAEKKDTPQYQHIGLGYLAAALEKNGIDVKVIDAKLNRLDFNQTLTAIIDLKPDIIGFTAMTHEINMADSLAKRAKEIMPGIKTVIGGVHVTALPAETLARYPSFDFGIRGEGESSFPELLNCIGNNHDPSPLSGIVYRAGADVLLSQPPRSIDDLDALAFPAWHQFLNASEYIIITGRGCPFSCIFCMQALGRKVRKRSPDNVVNEMERVINERKPKRFLFYDETFTLDKGRVYEICDLIIKKGINKLVKWSVTTRVDSVDSDILLKLKEAGCNHIEFGVESGDESVLRSIQKNITLRQAETAIKTAKELGFHTEGAFILGHPNETLETAYKTIHFAAKLNPDIIQLGIMVPYPGTEVAKFAKEGKGGYKIISENWSEYNKQLGNALELENLNRSDLERLQLIGYIKLFVLNKRFIDFMAFAWSYKREFFSFLRNHLRKDKRQQRSRLNIYQVIKMIFYKGDSWKYQSIV